MAAGCVYLQCTSCMLCPCPRVANACGDVCVSYDLVVSSPFVYWLGIATGTCVFYDIHAHTR